MPESHGRKKPAPRKKPVKRAAKRLTAIEVPDDTAEPPKPKSKRDIAREIPDERRYKPAPLPEPATRDQLLVALADLDPLAQEVMIASRLAAMPNPTDGPPINIHRGVRGPWAHQLRKLGIFCIPELATHELIAPDAAGMLVNHTGASLETLDRTDMWEKAKAQNPALGKLVDDAKTPAQKKAAMRRLVAKLPVDMRLAIEKLVETRPEDLEPV